MGETAEKEARVRAERMKTEKERGSLLTELRRRTAELEAVLSSMAVGVGIYDLEGHLVSLNPAGKKMTGYTERDMAIPYARRVSASRTETPDGRPISPEQTAAGRALRGETVRGFQFRVHFRNGEIHWLLANASPILTEDGEMLGAVANYVDITERKRMEDALRESEQRWATTLASIGDAVIATDIKGSITYMNPVAEKLTGWSLNEAAARPIGEVFNIINERTRQKADNPVLKVLQQGVVIGLANHTLLVTRDRTEIPIDDSAAPIRDRDDKTKGVVVVFRDISERRKAERIKDEFIGLVSHEMRTPLTVMLGGLHTLIHDGGSIPERERQDLLRDAYLETETMADVVENLLELSRAQANCIVLKPNPVVLEELLHGVVGKTMQQHGVRRVGIEVPPGILTVNADRTRLERILHNLVDNAFKYSPVESVIRVFARREGKELVLGVSDQGEGISSENQARLFQPFERLGKQTGQKPGSGIGLVVCRRLVEAHGGRIWVESEMGKGCSENTPAGATTILRLAAVPPGTPDALFAELPCAPHLTCHARRSNCRQARGTPHHPSTASRR